MQTIHDRIQRRALDAQLSIGKTLHPFLLPRKDFPDFSFSKRAMSDLNSSSLSPSESCLLSLVCFYFLSRNMFHRRQIIPCLPLSHFVAKYFWLVSSESAILTFLPLSSFLTSLRSFFSPLPPHSSRVHRILFQLFMLALSGARWVNPSKLRIRILNN